MDACSRAVLVTGGTTRLGLAIAAFLRSRGWRVLTSSHRPDAGADIVADLADPLGPARLYAAALQLAPDLSAIVNNAALYGSADPAAVRAVNFTAPCKLTMLLAGRENVRSAVVNVLDAAVLPFASDDAAAPDSAAAPSPYLRSKLDLLVYTRKSAGLFAETLRVNAVAPGSVLPPVGIHERAAERLLPNRPRPEDVAHAVSFLLENPAVTGCVVPVDSGAGLLALASL